MYTRTLTTHSLTVLLALILAGSLVGCPVSTGPTASFTAAPAEGAAPLDVTFTDTSTAGSAAITAWSWDFGDSGTSSDPNPSHTFTDPGTYTVSLAVTTSVGSNTSTRQVVVTDPPNMAPTASIKIIGMSEKDLEEAGLDTEITSGLNTVPVETYVFLTAEATDAEDDPLTYAWTVASAPGTSTAAGFVELKSGFDQDQPQNAIFYPDVVGTYEIEVAVSDGAKSVTTATQVIHASTWVGVGLVNKETMTLSSSTCTGCHSGALAADKFTPWLASGHASYFPRALDGEISSRYAERCMGCHVLGLNPHADNNGFDDVAAAVGWTFPETLEPGNWAALVADYPALAKLGGIQCESCHGPASQHASAAFADDKKLSVSLESGVCGQCHHQEVQWERSGHADEASRSFTYPIGPTRAACVLCHSGVAFIDAANGEETLRTDMQIHSCAVCHDPHEDVNPAQLRVYDAVVLPGDTAPRTGLGASATCMTCHNGRRGPSVALQETPHYSPVAEVLLGVNGITYGVNVPNSAHAVLTGCTDCHMAPTPGNIHDTVHTEGEDAVGGHTFAMAVHDPTHPDFGFENVANGCNTTGCHDANPLASLNPLAAGDYDGDGSVESVQDEVQGLLDLVVTTLEAKGVVRLASRPYWNYDAVAAEDVESARNAVWNYSLVATEGSLGIHNTGYSVGLLQLSYKDLTGNDVPGSTLRY
jgi:hypothetical protein